MTMTQGLQPTPPKQHTQSTSSELAMWGGIECTVNRVGDRWFDQLERSGHALPERISDLDRIAELGIRTLRYPVLWERTMPGASADARWDFVDQRLRRLEALGIRPVAGLVHHGSGPRTTSLVDPEFPAKLARYAAAVAERHPSIDAYTPVNEPLTTARFSGLYGHWYPHGRDRRSFVRALLHQCRAVALAMQSVRRVNPRAVLVQTEDLGFTRSTAPLQHQAAYENARRWLSFDLLFGHVDRAHPFYAELAVDGDAVRLLDVMRDEPCAPDLVGINYYVTSERFLDDRLDRYPASMLGGNGYDRYVDVEAVRVCEAGLHGAGALIHEAWARYGVPLVITEAHLGCHREEQMRWVRDMWAACLDARGAGVDVRALTTWALLGSFDWHTLLTRNDGRYESGAFDVHGPAPRATALATLVRELATGVTPSHPALVGAGWWDRSIRLAHGADVEPVAELAQAVSRRFPEVPDDRELAEVRAMWPQRVIAASAARNK